jgi:uncharacterized membrane protein
MTDKLIYLMTSVVALGCGLVGGIFFAFSTFVMKALWRLPAEQGVAAMQAINVAVLNRWFLAPFFGTAAGCLALSVLELLNSQWPGSLYRLIGCTSYLLGTIFVTMFCNVPRNDALAAVDSRNAEAAARWAEYVPAWTFWNHVRTVAALTAAASLLVALALSQEPAKGTPQILHQRNKLDEIESRIETQQSPTLNQEQPRD